MKVLSANHFGGLDTKSCPTLCDPVDLACQAHLFIGFPRQEYQTWLPFPPPGNLPDPGIKPGSPALQVGYLPTEPPRSPLTTMPPGNSQEMIYF